MPWIWGNLLNGNGWESRDDLGRRIVMMGGEDCYGVIGAGVNGVAAAHRRFMRLSPAFVESGRKMPIEIGFFGWPWLPLIVGTRPTLLEMKMMGFYFGKGVTM
ncbi:hypothetical protein ACLOJK_037363 [Asimina triloba]